MDCTFVVMLLLLDQRTDNTGEFVEEAGAVSQLCFNSLPAVGTLRFEFEALGDAGFTIKFGAVRAEGRIVSFAVADLAIKELL